MAMTDIVMARTRFDYYNPENGFGSYRDWWKLAQLSGFETCFVDEINVERDAVFIYAPHNGEIQNGWPISKARIIHYNLEQSGYPPIPCLSETWVSDARLAELTGAKYVMMGSHSGLAFEYSDNQ